MTPYTTSNNYPYSQKIIIDTDYGRKEVNYIRNSIKVLMEKTIDSELLKLEPTVILENMDITEKVMYLDYLTEDKNLKEDQKKNAVSFEEILKREGLTIDELQDKD